MPKVVSINGVGDVEFPDSMDDAAISKAIETEILSKRGVAKNVPGTVANVAAARLNLSRHGDTSLPVPPPAEPQHDTPGFWGSLAHAIGIPINQDDARAAALNAAFPGYSTVSGLMNAHNFQDVNRVLNPLALPAEQIGDKNYAGALGTVTPAALMLAAGTKPGTALMNKLAPARLPSTMMPIYGEPEVVPPSRLARGAEYAAREVVGKVPVVGTALADKLAGRIAKSGTRTPLLGYQDLTQLPQPAELGAARLQPIRPRVPGPEFDSLNPKVQSGSLHTGVEGSDVSPPPLIDAATGDAPNQPIQPTKPRKVGRDFMPRTEGGGFAPRKSIPLTGDSKPTTPAATVAWTDRNGLRNTGMVSTTIQSKSGPAHIVIDQSGKSRFVLAGDVDPAGGTPRTTFDRGRQGAEWPKDPNSNDENNLQLNTNPALLLPARFKNARNITWGTPLHQMPVDSNDRGLFGYEFDPKKRTTGQTKSANTALIDQSANDQPGTWTHELGHAIYNEDLSPAEQKRFQQHFDSTVADFVSKAQQTGAKGEALRQLAKQYPKAIIDDYVTYQSDRPRAYNEAFAEMAGQYMVNPSAFKAAHPQTYNLIKSLFGGKEYIQANKTRGSIDSARIDYSVSQSRNLKQNNP